MPDLHFIHQDPLLFTYCNKRHVYHARHVKELIEKKDANLMTNQEIQAIVDRLGTCMLCKDKLGIAVKEIISFLKSNTYSQMALDN